MGKDRTRRFFITGLATLLPTLLMVYLVYFVIITIHKHVGSRINSLFGVPESDWTTFLGDAIAFVLFIALVWLAGFLWATYIGKMLFRELDKVYRRTPLVRAIYPALKQLTDFFFGKQSMQFRRVVAIEYPRRGVYSIGFVTGEGLSEIRSQDGERLLSVFMPSSPAPFTGYTIFVRQDEMTTLDLTVDEALKLLVSGGVVVPDRLNVRSTPGGAPGKTGEEGPPAAAAPGL